MQSASSTRPGKRDLKLRQHQNASPGLASFPRYSYSSLLFPSFTNITIFITHSSCWPSNEKAKNENSPWKLKQRQTPPRNIR
jgi:hypothetical protein